MSNPKDIRKGKGFGFWGNTLSKPQVYLMRCFECGRENYMACVCGGVCAWCGYDANKDASIPKPADLS